MLPVALYSAGWVQCYTVGVLLSGSSQVYGPTQDAFAGGSGWDPVVGFPVAHAEVLYEQAADVEEE